MFGNARLAGRELHKAIHAGATEPPQQPSEAPVAGVKRGLGDVPRPPQPQGQGQGQLWQQGQQLGAAGSGVHSAWGGGNARFDDREADDDPEPAPAPVAAAAAAPGFQSSRMALAREEARRNGGASSGMGGGGGAGAGGGGGMDDPSAGGGSGLRRGPAPMATPSYSAPQAGAKAPAAGLRRTQQQGGFKPPLRGGAGEAAPQRPGSSGGPSAPSGGRGGGDSSGSAGGPPSLYSAPVAGGRRGLLEEFTPDQLPPVLQSMDPKL